MCNYKVHCRPYLQDAAPQLVSAFSNNMHGAPAGVIQLAYAHQSNVSPPASQQKQNRAGTTAAAYITTSS